MNNMNSVKHLLGLGALSIFVWAAAAPGSRAQDTSSTTIRHGAASYDTTVRNAEVVYVEGNDLVLKLEDGRVEHLVVPEEDKFTIDGKEVSVHELTPGTKLTQTITTTTTPRYVNTVRTLEGKVFHVNPPLSVIVTLPDGANHLYKVPSHAKFIVNGEPKTVFELRKGMQFKATIVTDYTHTTVAQTKSVLGQAPTPATPQLMGVLLFRSREPVEPSVATVTVVHHPLVALPETGTSLPLVGLLGGLAIMLPLGYGVLRRPFNA